MIRRNFIRRAGITAVVAGLCPSSVLAGGGSSRPFPGKAPSVTLLASVAGPGGRPGWKLVPRFSPRAVVDGAALLRIRVSGLFDAGSGELRVPYRDDRIFVEARTGSLLREHRFDLLTAAEGRVNGCASRIHALASAWRGFAVHWRTQSGERLAHGDESRVEASYARVRIASPGHYALLIAPPGVTPRFDVRALGRESELQCPLRPAPELAGMLCLPIMLETVV